MGEGYGEGAWLECIVEGVWKVWSRGCLFGWGEVELEPMWGEGGLNDGSVHDVLVESSVKWKESRGVCFRENE